MADKFTAYYKKATAFLLSFLLFFVSSNFGIGKEAKNPLEANKVDYFFDDCGILIGGYGYNTDFTDDEHLSYVSDAKIDFLVSGANLEFLDACERNGIGVIAKNFGGLPTYGWTNIDKSQDSPWLTFSPQDFVDHPALWGNDLMDEPAADAFEALSQMIRSYNSKTQGKIAYVNLYPAYASEEQLGTTADWFTFSKEFDQLNSYQKHINAYIETIDADYISADIYPLLTKKDQITGEAYHLAHPTWLKNLDILASACRKTNRDLWLITQVTGLEYEGSGITRIATEEDIRLQAYTSISFGAKAIIHACYQNGWWAEESHMVTTDGERNPIYYHAKAVNEEIKAVSEAYKNYNNIGAFLHNPLKENHTKVALSKVDFKQVSNISSDETLLFGCFEAKEGNGAAFTVVNMTEVRSNTSASVSFKLKGAKAVTAYIKGTATELSADAKSNYSLNLDSGEGVFVTVEY